MAGGQRVNDPNYDAVVIGSGAGGSSWRVGWPRRPASCWWIERGEGRPQADPAKPVGHYLYHLLKQPSDPAAFIGGATKFYGASLYRMRESDFVRSRTRPASRPRWPITYAELEPYYLAAERCHRVHGRPRRRPCEPPRSAPFPHPPLRTTLVADVVRRLADSGSEVSPIPRGLDYGDGGKCVLCPTCDGYYCAFGAKMDAETAAAMPSMRTMRTSFSSARLNARSSGR